MKFGYPPAGTVRAGSLAASFSKTNNTLATVSDLSMPIEANQTLRLEYMLALWDDVALNGNWKLGFALPAGAAQQMMLLTYGDDNHNTGIWPRPNFDDFDAEVALHAPATATLLIALTVINGGTDGSVALRFAQRITNAEASQLLVGSNVMAIAT